MPTIRDARGRAEAYGLAIIEAIVEAIVGPGA